MPPAMPVQLVRSVMATCQLAVASPRTPDASWGHPLLGEYAAGFPSPSPRTNGLVLPDGRVREVDGARINIFLSLEQRRSPAGRG